MKAKVTLRTKKLTLAVAITSALSAPVFAQQSSGTDSAVDEKKMESIQVTGSRVSRDGYDTPTPVASMSEEDINTFAPNSVADFVNTMPSVTGSSTASTSSGSLSNGASGIAALNLRALGTGRTLVLFDGQRSVVSASTGQVDTNTFPQSLIKRVEIVTGGASSVYGSDAISGVVNFILDKEYTGFKSEVEYGETTYGDRENNKIVLTYGTELGNGDGHLLLSGETFHANGIHNTTREYAEDGSVAMINPDTSDGAPFYFVGNGIGISNYTPGGLIASGPLEGTYFGVDGAPGQLAYGDVSGQWMIGGDWQYTTSGMIGTNSLAAEIDRKNLFGRLSWMFGETEVFLQGSYAEYEGLSYYINPTSKGVTIYADNAYLPSSVSAQMAELGLDSFSLNTSNVDMPASGSNNKRDTTRIVVGADGEFTLAGKFFNWDAYYQYGKTNTDEHMTSTYNSSRLTLATDAVVDPGTGNIVCRSTLTDPSNGCVPLNRLGVGVASDEALNYVLGRPRREQSFIQDVAAINFSTNELEGWAGPISIAFGAEYRSEEMDGEVDSQYSTGWKYGNYKVTEGSYNVKEAYLEALVPVMEDLDFNGAVRYTDYSTSGGVTTWKTGLTWSPIDDATFRLTRSKDIRAPNLSELYAAGTARSNSVTINGASVPMIQNLQGNPNVSPEEGDSWGLGVVLRPSFLEGFSATIDYYEVEIEGVISFVSADATAEYCVEFGVQRYCDNMIYDESGTLQTINLLYENLNAMTAKGVDYDLTYRFDTADIIDGAPGDFKLRFLATNYLEAITDNGVTAIDQAGSVANSTPDWKYRASVTYSLDDMRFDLTARGISEGTLSNAYIECSSNCPESIAPNYTINDNTVAAKIYLDAYASKSIPMGDTGSLELYMQVRNLLNSDPAEVTYPAFQGSENRPGYLATNRSLYDVLGRQFKVGFRLEL
ncbi:TonB-dependent siderophore receptor [Aestuariibacter sp. A3R04]|uniref:TonB-dependent receptor plug domain-containing protein n=1 Tax=Aestuariibacter sp. A3R04 TaxID=2841571 RepID=UPI001C084D1D|nr:TonB-dependent receptor [Aestuariibacter sp. A3R04]MBU3021716.1 TonB-dependent receptor [Aestuariibacter sp. A3R04]